MKEINYNNLPQSIQYLLDRIEYVVRILEKLNFSEEKPEMMTIEECSDLISLSKHSIYSLCSKRKLPHIKKGRRLYFEREKILEYLLSGRRQTKTEISKNAMDNIIIKPKRNENK